MTESENNIPWVLVAMAALAYIVYTQYQEANTEYKKKYKKELSMTDWITSITKSKVGKLFIGCTVIIGGLGLISYNGYLKDVNQSMGGKSFIDWINGSDKDGVFTPTTKTIMVGMVYGIVFGFIDNAGLFFGMDALDKYFRKYSNDDKVIAGMGNTFSDAIGSFAGSFAGDIIKKQTQVDKTPMWSEAIGIIVGCLLGIVIPKAMLTQ